MLFPARPFRLALVSTALVVCSLLPQMLRGQSASDASLSKKVIATAAPAPLLPESFAGFELQGKLDKATEPGTADAGNAQVLVEDGFRDFASGTYKNNINTVTV